MATATEWQEETPSCTEKSNPRRTWQLLGEREQVRLQSDLDLSGRYGQCWLLITDQRVLTFADDPDSASQPQAAFALSEIKDADTEIEVSTGILVLTLPYHRIEVIRFSRTYAAHFADAARIIRSLSEGVPAQPSDRLPRVRCPRCGRLLPGRYARCPVCIRTHMVLLRIAGYLKPHRAVAAALVVATLGRTMIQLIPPLVTRRMIDSALQGHGGGTIDQRFHLVVSLVGILIAAALAGAVMQTVNQWLATLLGGRITAQMRSEIYRKLEHLPLTFHNDRGTGSLLALINQDTAALEQFLVQGVPFVATNVLLFIFILVVLVKVQWQLALVVLFPVPLMFFGSRYIWTRTNNLYRRWWRIRAMFSSRLSESLYGIRVLKAFVQEDREAVAFDQHNATLREIGIQTTVLSQRLATTLNFINSTGVFLVWLFGGHDVIYGVISLGTLVMFNSYLGQFYAPLQYFNQVSQWMSQAFAGAERVFEVLDAPEEPYKAPGAIVLSPLRGSVEFRDVSFSYERGKPALKHISACVQPGEMIGLVGRSGSGKSTFIHLINRFYEPDSGQILVDGIDLQHVDLPSFREQVGVVLQDPFLFDGTIAENIAYARPDATFQEIVAAAKAANAHDFIVNREDGYSFRVGERGHRLSGGERQRISIARAILCDPKLLILDEATASVDTETERLIQEALTRLVQKRTTFAIAHRLSTLRNANRLFVFESGEVKEIGTHDELMEMPNGIYRRLVELQREVSRIRVVGG
ncbi:MAG: ABC transporter transmembrane domain-containing protein [Chloroflexi bacterium]|nr:ABC transporter transmembrane domain-containing protein [Chloroflexota bacterium]